MLARYFYLFCLLGTGLLPLVASAALPLPVRRQFAGGQITAGFSHSLAVTADGKLYAWGDNIHGQLGNNSTTDSSVPVAVSQGAIPIGTRFVQVVAGQDHSLALAADGRLYAWGDNPYGQLGNSSTTKSTVPVAVSQGAIPAGTRFVQVAAGQRYSLALAADGRVYTWGDNAQSQLGNNTGNDSTVPVAVSQGATPAGTRFVQVAIGQEHSLALAATGIIYVWGNNANGELGNNTGNDSAVPVAISQGAIPAGTRFVQVMAGQEHSLALAADGRLYAWGYNTHGELGNNSTNESKVPVAVSQGNASAGTRFVQVMGGEHHSLALAADGTIYAWGDNNQGQLGNNSTTSSTVPIGARFPAAAGYAQVVGGASHSLGLRADGTVSGWGYNNDGQLGNSSTTDSALPVAVSQGAAAASTRFGQVAAGQSHSLALAADGTIYAWGANGSGQLGNNSTASSTVPVAVNPGAISAGTRQLAAGQLHSLALAADGTLYSWGANASGQLGNNSTTDSAVPVAVSPGAAPAGTYFVQVAAGQLHSLALAADGTIYAWGANGSGQLGINSTTDSAVPVAVSLGDAPAGTRFVQVAAGQLHSLALAADGTLYSWGANASGQLGNNSATSSAVPVAVSPGAAPAGTYFVQVAGGLLHSLALAADGTIYAWGANGSGQLGINSTTDSAVPAAEYSALTGWRGLASGSLANHSLVLGDKAAFFTAGRNLYGQLGDGSTTNSLIFLRNKPSALVGPLPVELTAFTAQAQGPRAIQLAWTTASETNSAYFALERSSDESSFAEITRLPTASRSGAHTYAYRDAALPALALRLYYRLRQVDLDGSTTYSPVRVVTLQPAARLMLYPNPAQANTQLTGAAPGAAVQVFDMQSRLVHSTSASATGTTPLELPTGLAPGVYLVHTGAQTLRMTVE